MTATIIIRLVTILVTVLTKLCVQSQIRLSRTTAGARTVDSCTIDLRHGLASRRLTSTVTTRTRSALTRSLSLVTLGTDTLRNRTQTFVRLTSTAGPRRAKRVLAPRLQGRTSLVRRGSRRVQQRSTKTLSRTRSVVNVLHRPRRTHRRLTPTPRASVAHPSLSTLVGSTHSTNVHVGA